jgi:hypothetical protein
VAETSGVVVPSVRTHARKQASKHHPSHGHISTESVWIEGKKMSYLMQSLTKKEEVDELIRNTIDKVLVLRIGRASDPVCMQLDEIVGEIYFVLLCICCPYARVIESSPQKKKSSPLHFLILHLLDELEK